jgi:hypothetical protein
MTPSLPRAGQGTTTACAGLIVLAPQGFTAATRNV